MTVSSGDTIKNREDLTSLGSDDSGILCSSEGDATTRESSVEQLASIDHSRESLDSTVTSSTSDESVTEKPQKDDVSLPLTKRILMSKKITFFTKKTAVRDSDVSLKCKDNISVEELTTCNLERSENETEMDNETNVEKANSVKAESSQERSSATYTVAPLEISHNSDGKGFLLRLFECKLFDMSMAITYLFNSKEPGVQSYIGNMLFNFLDHEVDFYLPQLVCMYLQMPDVAEVIHPYLVHRCRDSADFSLKCAWLLDAYSSDAQVPSKRKSNGTKLRNLILSDNLRPKESDTPAVVKRPSRTSTDVKIFNTDEKTTSVPPPPPPPLPSLLTPTVKTHQRSKSDATGLILGNRKITTFGKVYFLFIAFSSSI